MDSQGYLYAEAVGAIGVPEADVGDSATRTAQTGRGPCEGRALRFADVVHETFTYADPETRQTLLRRLLPHIRPMALATLADGAFAGMLYQRRRDDLPLEARRFPDVSAAEAVVLADYLTQCGDAVVAGICSRLAADLRAYPGWSARYAALWMQLAPPDDDEPAD